MITHIRMKNFKSWKDSGEVKLAPLTGFFGTNSSGKSSLLQMLLLLKQTAERKDAEEVIFFGDNTSLANLGNFREVIHGHQQEKQLCLEFGCKLKTTYKIAVLGKRPDGNDGLVQIPIDNFSFYTIFNGVGKDFENDMFRYSFKSCKVPEVKWERGSLSHTDLFGLLQSQKIKGLNCYGGPSQGHQHILLNPLSLAIEELFSHVFYLGPVRAHPQRLYHWEGDHPKDIGRMGDKTIDALLSARVDRKTTLHDEEIVSIEERISQWLREMNLAHTFILERTEQQGGKDYDVHIQMNENSPEIALADMGYGLSQFLPVLVLCYYAPEGSTLILEQPGIHLHPKVQSQLADLLIEVVNDRNLQILVESHSEHLLTRLQLRIAEQKIAANQTALYFCENENGTSKIKSLEIDDFGNITNWPKDFFGNVRGDLKKMARQQIKRQKEAES